MTARSWTLLGTCLAVVVAVACAPTQPARGAHGEPSDEAPIPRITEVPAGTLSCRAAAAKVPPPPEAPTVSLSVRAAFAGCYRPPCPPCPPEVTCSPCEQGWCELAGEADEPDCKLRFMAPSPECVAMKPGVVYVSKLVPSGGALDLATCSEVVGAPRVATQPPAP